jgi:hypothetical protein
MIQKGKMNFTRKHIINANPSHSGGSHQEDCSSKTVRTNSLQDPISKKKSQKRASGVAQGGGPEFKPQYRKKKKKKKKKELKLNDSGFN